MSKTKLYFNLNSTFFAHFLNSLKLIPICLKLTSNEGTKLKYDHFKNELLHKIPFGRPDCKNKYNCGCLKNAHLCNLSIKVRY